MSMGTLHLRIRGPVTHSICRTTMAGLPLVEVHLTDAASGQQVHVRHRYNDASAASHSGAAALARSLHGQVAELYAINPKLKPAPHGLRGHAHHSTRSNPVTEGGSESGASERGAQTCPIKAQSAAVARATASICNADGARFCAPSGRAGFALTLTAQGSAMTPRIYLIGLTGPAGCGKDTVAQLLRVHRDAWPLAFADALRQELFDAFGVPPEYLTQCDSKERPTATLALERCLGSAFVHCLQTHHRAGTLAPAQPDGQPLNLTQPRSPRTIMQWWGTEYRRQQDSRYWVDRALARIQWLRQEQYAQTIVLTDLRFANEAALVRSLGGQIWRITRPGAGCGAPTHASQVSGEQFAPDLTLNNTHHIRHLQQLVLDAWDTLALQHNRTETAQ